MAWLKKNLVLVVSGAVALVLLGVAVYFLFQQHSLEAQVTEELTAQTTELDRLTKLDPHPGAPGKTDNIVAAVEQEKLLQTFAEDARKTFVPLAYPTNLDSGQLKLMMDTTINELQTAAKKGGVRLQEQYAFTFAAQKPMMAYEQATILPLARMLIDIKTISQYLFDARVLTLDGIRRSAVTSQDTPSATPGMSDYWNKKATTNDLAVLTPYEFTFHCFAGELAAVLESVYRSPHGLLVKNVAVDMTPSQLLEKTETGTAESPMMPMGQGMNMMQMQMMMRYGMRGMRTPIPQEAAPPPPTAKGGLSPMLDEKPFRVVLWLDVLRLRDPEEVKASKPARPARGARPDQAPGEGEAAPGDAPAEGDAAATDGQSAK